MGITHGNSKWTDEKVEEIIKDRLEKGQSLKGIDVRKDFPGMYRYISRKHGKYMTYLKKLGYDIEKIKGNKWTDETVYNLIYTRIEEGKGIRAKDMKEEYPGAYSYISKKYKGWNSFLESRGVLVAREISQELIWTEKKVIDLIKGRIDKGKSVSAGVMTKEYRGAYDYIYRNHGPWNEYINSLELGIPKLKIKTKWARDKVDKLIRERIEKGESIRSSEIQKKYKGLYQYVRDNFGNWYDYLETLGIDTEEIRVKQWSDNRIEYLVRKRRTEGKSVRATDMYREFRGAYNYVLRNHGSWNKYVESIYNK